MSLLSESTIFVSQIRDLSQAIVNEVERVIVGKTHTVRFSVLTLLCNGHLLLEDIPGVGKTTLAKSLAKSVGGEFRRIQFTPDLLPSEITGTSIYNQKAAEFEFRPGPIFGNVVLVDEINRATPKTQSALLEAMDERQITTDGVSRDLPTPFFVIATQNSVEMTGTYPLPEAQLDRFFMRLALGYPERASEKEILDRQQTSHPLSAVRPVIELDELVELQRAVSRVFVHDELKEYIVAVVGATRESNELLMGASPRATLQLMRAAQAHAAMAGLDFVRPDDVKAVAAPLLAHRVMARPGARGGVGEIIDRLLMTVVAPSPAK